VNQKRIIISVLITLLRDLTTANVSGVVFTCNECGHTRSFTPAPPSLGTQASSELPPAPDLGGMSSPSVVGKTHANLYGPRIFRRERTDDGPGQRRADSRITRSHTTSGSDAATACGVACKACAMDTTQLYRHTNQRWRPPFQTGVQIQTGVQRT